MFFRKILHLDKFDGANFKYDNNFFLNSSPHLVICFSFSEICTYINSRVLISNMTILFSNSRKKYPNKAFLVSSLDFFFCETLQLDKFDGADFNYDSIRQVRWCSFQL